MPYSSVPRRKVRYSRPLAACRMAGLIGSGAETMKGNPELRVPNGGFF